MEKNVCYILMLIVFKEVGLFSYSGCTISREHHGKVDFYSSRKPFLRLIFLIVRYTMPSPFIQYLQFIRVFQRWGFLQFVDESQVWKFHKTLKALKVNWLPSQRKFFSSFLQGWVIFCSICDRSTRRLFGGHWSVNKVKEN